MNSAIVNNTKAMRNERLIVLTGDKSLLKKKGKSPESITQHLMTAAGHLNIREALVYSISQTAMI